MEGRKLVDPKEPVQIGEARKKRRKEGKKEKKKQENQVEEVVGRYLALDASRTTKNRL